MSKSSEFGCTSQFLLEERTEAYREYVEGAQQRKIGLGAKNSGRVYGFAENQAAVARRF